MTATALERLPQGPARFLLVTLFALAIWLPGFATLPAIDRDESRFAQATKQMLETGDFIDIRFQAEPRYKKPIGIYWLQAVAVSLAGETARDAIWPYRLPSLLGGLAALLVLVALGDRLFGAPVGLVAGLLMAAVPLTGIEVRMATTDAVLLACCLVAQWALAGIYLRRDALRGVGQPWRHRWGEPLLFWIAIGAGILIKGPIVLLVAGGTILGLAIMERRGAWLLDLRPVAGLAIVLALVLPWFLAIMQASDGAFADKALGHDFLGKLTGIQESHFGPPGTYLLAFCLTFWPATLVVAFAAPALWRARGDDPVRFCLAWIVPAWIAFELALTKLPHYVLPLYPAIAVLTAQALSRLPRFVAGPQETRHRARRNAAFAGWFGIGLALGSLGLLLPWLLGAPLPDLAWAIPVLLAIPLGLALFAFQRAQPAALLASLLVAAALVAVPLYGWILPQLDRVWLTRAVAAAVEAHRPCPDTTLLAAGYHEPSLVFTLGTQTALVAPSEAATRLSGDPRCGLALIGAAEAGPFQARLAELGRRAHALATVDGFNYSNGDAEHLTLFQAD